MRLNRAAAICGAAVFTAACSAPSSTQPPPPPAAAGVAPAADQDGDGIPDAWETDGVPYKDPVTGAQAKLDLKSRGLSPQHKDIIVWVVWMKEDNHSHEPQAGAIALVQTAFAKSPVRNLDGSLGVNVHLFVQPQPIREQQPLGRFTPIGNNKEEYDWSEFDKLKAQFFPKEFGDAVFFAVFGHNIGNRRYSGITKNIPGRDLIVSIGSFVGTPQEQGATLMHELGHALGLRHGGADDRNYKPSYLSVMNYDFQMTGLKVGGNFDGIYDFSQFSTGTDEQHLNEQAGATGDKNLAQYGSYFHCCKSCKTPRAMVEIDALFGEAVDWNCDGQTKTQVASDVNDDQDETTLSSQKDWDCLRFTLAAPGCHVGGARSGTGASAEFGAPGEITPEEADRIPIPRVRGVRAAQRGPAVVVEWRKMALDQIVAYTVLRSVGNESPAPLRTVDALSAPAVTDTQPAARARYFVSAVFVPHSLEAQLTGEMPQLPWFNRITDERLRAIVRDTAPVAMAESRKRGAGGRGDAQAPRVLLQTRLSEAADVVVR